MACSTTQSSRGPIGCTPTLRASLCALAALLAGCGPGGGSGQAPDPVVAEQPVAFVQRTLDVDPDSNELRGDDRREPDAFRPGARLYLKDRAAPSAALRDITSSLFADDRFLDDEGELRYDVKDLAVSYDGNRLLFALRAPEVDDQTSTWNIWEYDVANDLLRRVIASDTQAEAGHDIAPDYLPDGRIVFASTRQRTAKAILLDEGKPQFDALDEDLDAPAFVLHVMANDGSDIEQITFNQSHDLDPTVLANGKILFSRWDNAGQTRDNGFNLYQVNPDGTGLAYVFGRHSHDSVEGQTVHYFRPLAYNGQVLAQVRPFASQSLAALPALLDTTAFVEADQRLDGSEGDGQVAVVAGYDGSGEPNLNGSYGAASPLFDGTDRYLVSWSPCRLREAFAEGDDRIVNCTEERLAAPDDYDRALPIFGLWLLDKTSVTQLPVQAPEEGVQVDEAVLMIDRPLPTHLAPAILDSEAATLANSGYGAVHIRSVYDVDGTDTAPGGIRTLADPVQTEPAARPAMFVRFEKPVSIPDDEVREVDRSAFGRSAAQGMREILGYAPVEPDGSVRAAVPANVAFAISVLDGNGERLSARHQNWLQVRPGETLTCHGCHDPGSDVPHGRPDAGPASVYSGARTTGLEFPNTDPTLVADMGETMAQTYSRINGIRQLQPDLVFEDQWSNDAVVAKAAPFAYRYADLSTPSPVSAACAASWSGFCRTVIHYEQHIHPLWGLDRQIIAADGVTVLDDYTCTGCHSDQDADGALRLPDSQLDLSDGPSPDQPDHFNAYRELLFNDNEQEIIDGALTDVLVDTGEIERDEDGVPILDAEGNTIPVFTTVNVPASMNTAGARASSRFLDRFRGGGSHQGFLTDVELKLIAEWLDLGGQYYNNPFDTPED